MFQYMIYTPMALPSCYILRYHTREDYPASNHSALLSSSAFEYRTQFAVFKVFAKSTIWVSDCFPSSNSPASPHLCSKTIEGRSSMVLAMILRYFSIMACLLVTKPCLVMTLHARHPAYGP
jgi:hypothetical protein